MWSFPLHVYPSYLSSLLWVIQGTFPSFFHFTHKNFCVYLKNTSKYNPCNISQSKSRQQFFNNIRDWFKLQIFMGLFSKDSSCMFKIAEEAEDSGKCASKVPGMLNHSSFSPVSWTVVQFHGCYWREAGAPAPREYTGSWILILAPLIASYVTLGMFFNICSSLSFFDNMGLINRSCRIILNIKLDSCMCNTWDYRADAQQMITVRRF